MTRGNDLSIYSKYAEEWWRPGSPRFRSLQNLTPFRLEMIREACGPVQGKRLYDLGCGGGLLAVPLLDDGAIVTGVDLSAESLRVARVAARGRGTFIEGDVTRVELPSDSADIVLLADVLDHVPDYHRALAEAARLTKPGGTVFAGTINRTIASYIAAIVLGEGLRLVPPGTHRHDMFITPEELLSAAKMAGLRHQHTYGERIAVWDTVSRWAVTFKRSARCSVAYSMVFERS